MKLAFVVFVILLVSRFLGMGFCRFVLEQFSDGGFDTPELGRVGTLLYDHS